MRLEVRCSPDSRSVKSPPLRQGGKLHSPANAENSLDDPLISPFHRNTRPCCPNRLRHRGIVPNAKPEERLAAGLDANSLESLHGQLTILGLGGLGIPAIEAVRACKIRSNSQKTSFEDELQAMGLQSDRHERECAIARWTR
jgi:hypothetical protein